MILIIIRYGRLYKRVGPDIVGEGPYAAAPTAAVRNLS